MDPRQLRSLSAGIPLTLLLLAILLWIAGRCVPFAIQRTPQDIGNAHVQFQTDAAGIGLLLWYRDLLGISVDRDLSRRLTRQMNWSLCKPSDDPLFDPDFSPRSVSYHSLPGLLWITTRDEGYIARTKMIRIHHAYVIVLFAILPLLHLRAIINRRRLARIGHCPSCGYDLRASPGRCPECGHAAPPVAD